MRTFEADTILSQQAQDIVLRAFRLAPVVHDQPGRAAGPRVTEGDSSIPFDVVDPEPDAPERVLPLQLEFPAEGKRDSDADLVAGAYAGRVSSGERGCYAVPSELRRPPERRGPRPRTPAAPPTSAPA